MARIDLAKEMARLGEITPDELREKWERLTGGPVPNVSPRLLRMALAWELQAKVHGGLSRGPNSGSIRCRRPKQPLAKSTPACGWCASGTAPSISCKSVRTA